jgi:uncharacterized protein YciI
MAKYAVIYQDEQEGELEWNLLNGHVEHLKKLHSQGYLLMCGPLKDSKGKALLIYDANSREEVESYVLKDPFIIHKRYAGYLIYEWHVADDSNNWLM